MYPQSLSSLTGANPSENWPIRVKRGVIFTFPDLSI